VQGFDLRVFFLKPLLNQSLVVLLRAVRGFWQVMRSCARSRLMELALKFTSNFDLISVAIISRVHNANANFSCNGFFRGTVS
jgi:hypothetical protein